jgi:hypothetical protein
MSDRYGTIEERRSCTVIKAIARAWVREPCRTRGGRRAEPESGDLRGQKAYPSSAPDPAESRRKVHLFRGCLGSRSPEITCGTAAPRRRLEWLQASEEQRRFQTAVRVSIASSESPRSAGYVCSPQPETAVSSGSGSPCPPPQPTSWSAGGLASAMEPMRISTGDHRAEGDAQDQDRTDGPLKASGQAYPAPKGK